ncbi:hypothetical protein PMSD_07640 [Paenibacillus macquariensis subsp. defensor]|nr:hypothetical protein PMSD_07640 [Paenibacillus macquariensis subsp. defensor]
MNIVMIVIQCFFIFMFLVAGTSKLLGSKQQVEIFKEINLPQWLRIVTGLVEVLGAIALVIGFFDDKFVAIGGLIIGSTMLGATGIHMIIKDAFKKVLPPFIFALLALSLSLEWILQAL